MRKRNSYKIITLLTFIIGLNSCEHEAPQPEAPEISFSKHVQPIITGNCTADGCHDAANGEFPLLSYNDVIKYGEIKKEEGSETKLVEVLKSNDPGERMPQPPSKPLTADQIQIIELWITQGAKNN